MADSSEPAISCGWVVGEISETPAASIGSRSTMRTTRWSRIRSIGKSVTRVRANSLSTSESRSSPVSTRPHPRAEPRGPGGQHLTCAAPVAGTYVSTSGLDDTPENGQEN